MGSLRHPLVQFVSDEDVFLMEYRDLVTMDGDLYAVEFT